MKGYGRKLSECTAVKRQGGNPPEDPALTNPLGYRGTYHQCCLLAQYSSWSSAFISSGHPLSIYLKWLSTCWCLGSPSRRSAFHFILFSMAGDERQNKVTNHQFKRKPVVKQESYIKKHYLNIKCFTSFFLQKVPNKKRKINKSVLITRATHFSVNIN